MLFRVTIAAFVAAFVAVPLTYSHRMNDQAFCVNLMVFVGAPLVAAATPNQLNRSGLHVAAGLLLICPIVYVITDQLDSKFEKLRDAYFLGTGCVLLFVSADRLIASYKSGKWTQFAVAGLGVALSSFANFILLWMVSYFE